MYDLSLLSNSKRIRLNIRLFPRLWRGIFTNKICFENLCKLYTLAKPRQYAYRALRAIKLQKVRDGVIYCKYLKVWA